jgi:catechol 2,3-dioxygenase-like lactoylglutathione lyase family enzyme
MEPGFDHVTIAVTDLDDALHFFELLGFEETQNTLVTGEVMAAYMGIPEWEADHVTLVASEAPTHQEVQLLRFHNPPIAVDTETGNLARTGFNHVCFRVGDLTGTLERLETAGIKTRNEVMHFHDRDLVFLEGPGGVVIELAEWLTT